MRLSAAVTAAEAMTRVSDERGGGLADPGQALGQRGPVMGQGGADDLPEEQQHRGDGGDAQADRVHVLDSGRGQVDRRDRGERAGEGFQERVGRGGEGQADAVPGAGSRAAGELAGAAERVSDAA